MIHCGVTDLNLPACNRWDALACNDLCVPAADFARYAANTANMCQRCVKLANHQAGKHTKDVSGLRTDSERYAELRQLVECWQKNLGQAHKDALIQWKHR